MSALVLPKLTDNLPNKSIDVSGLTLSLDSQLADPNFYISRQVDILIGADFYPKIIRNDSKKKVLGDLTAHDFQFGWVLFGSISNRRSNVQTCLTITRNRNSKSNYSICRICRGDHPLKHCQKFLQVDYEERMRLVSFYKFCVRCLSHDHTRQNCGSTGECKYCGESHHFLLHKKSIFGRRRELVGCSMSRHSTRSFYSNGHEREVRSSSHALARKAPRNERESPTASQALVASTYKNRRSIRRRTVQRLKRQGKAGKGIRVFSDTSPNVIERIDANGYH